MKDGGEIAIDYNKNGERKPLIIIVPGIMGDIFDDSQRTLINEATDKGYNWALINYRGVTHPLSTGIPFCTFEFDWVSESI